MPCNWATKRELISCMVLSVNGGSSNLEPTLLLHMAKVQHTKKHASVG